MKNNYELQHKVALLNPYKSVVKVFDANEENYLVGIKNVASIPNTLMHKLEPFGFSLHTIDKKSQLAGRAVDTELINPISGRYMSGSSSGTAINVFCGINDLGIGNDGGGSVLAPAISLNIYSIISKQIEKDRVMDVKPNTEGILATNSIGFMSRNKELLYKAFNIATNISVSDNYGKVFSDKKYENINSEIVDFPNLNKSRNELVPILKDILNKCDIYMVTEGPIDIDGFGDSLFGHFDYRTKKIQDMANKGYVKLANMAGATCLSVPLKELGCSILLMCEDNIEKISKLLFLGTLLEDVHDELIERYFLDLNNYFIEGYKI